MYLFADAWISLERWTSATCLTRRETQVRPITSGAHQDIIRCIICTRNPSSAHAVHRLHMQSIVCTCNPSSAHAVHRLHMQFIVCTCNPSSAHAIHHAHSAPLLHLRIGTTVYSAWTLTTPFNLRCIHATCKVFWAAVAVRELTILDSFSKTRTRTPSSRLLFLLAANDARQGQHL
jgi:ribosomal protein S26